jgi:TonB family protein
MESKLIFQTTAQYPADAKQARIEGDVVLTAIIAKDGRVMQLDVKSGHPLLACAAVEAVRRWQYQPTLLNGQPVEVVTSIHVNFVLGTSPGAIVSKSPGAPPPESLAGDQATPKRIRVGSSVHQAKLISKTPPVYPPDAKKAGIEGTVRVKVVIATDGSVQPLGVESGHPLLAPAAIEAVRQWKYRPTMVQGEPVEVTTVIDVTFALDDKR